LDAHPARYARLGVFLKLRAVRLAATCKPFMLLYYITDRWQFPGNESLRCARLLAKIGEAARAGVDYIQLRERDLTARDLEDLARRAMDIVREANLQDNARRGRTRLLINSRIDIALAVGAGGVHLRSNEISAGEARSIWAKAISAKAGTCDSIFAVSCHTCDEVRLAQAHGANFAVFAPVFEKAVTQTAGAGLEALREACRYAGGGMPILALGGITLQNARPCLEAGAAGIAGIRLFQEYDMEETVQELRSIESCNLRLNLGDGKR
jgi:thiamine-phosphate pyrophosphorylase